MCFFRGNYIKYAKASMGLQNPKKPQLNSMEHHFFKKKLFIFFTTVKNHGLGVLSTTSFRIVFFQMPSFCSNFLKNPKPPPLQGLEIDDITQSKTTSGVKFHGVHGQTYRVLTHPHTKLRGEDEAKVALDDLAQLVEAGLVVLTLLVGFSKQTR